MKFSSYLAFLPLLSLSTASKTQKPLTKESSKCQHPHYEIHLYSHDPLVIYISNFLSPKERRHLQEISKDTFTNSAIADEVGAQRQSHIRTSQSTSLPNDPIVDCISERARLFQGFDTPASHLEALQLVQYTQNQTYSYHTDWFVSASQATAEYGGNRLSSFFVYVANEDVTGGGTNFPMVDSRWDGGWCEFVDCDEEWERGVTFRPVEGNAVFWRNLDVNGRGDERTLHAGLPVTSGRKVGMNIWTREGPLSEDVRLGRKKR